MPAAKERLAEVRRRRPFVDHVLRMQEHYGSVKAGQQAGAVTYFAFLSFFPILALAFFVVGWVAKYYADVRTDLEKALNGIIPELIGDAPGQVQISSIEDSVATLGIVGLLVLIYSGLGWLSALRAALVVVFEVSPQAAPNFVFGKLRDLLTLVLLGVILLVSVAVAGLVGGFPETVLGWMHVDLEIGWLVKLLTVVIGFGANMLLFFAIFQLLVKQGTPRRSLWSGALLGAIAFEILKQISARLFASTTGSPAFQAFGIALILLIWINYFSRVILYSAAWAHTTAAARAGRPVPVADPVAGPPSPPVEARFSRPDESPTWRAPYAAGAASMLGLVAVARKVSRRTARKDS